MNEKILLIGGAAFLVFLFVTNTAKAAARIATEARDTVLDPVTRPLGSAIVRLSSGPGVQLTPEAEERLRLAREQGLL